MINCKFGDILLLKFPFTDGISFKKRPALVIKDTNDGDIIVCRITSKSYDSIYDIALNDWNKFGLKLPSVARIHKIATLEKDMIEIKLGEVDDTIKSQILHQLINSIQLLLP